MSDEERYTGSNKPKFNRRDFLKLGRLVSASTTTQVLFPSWLGNLFYSGKDVFSQAETIQNRSVDSFKCYIKDEHYRDLKYVETLASINVASILNRSETTEIPSKEIIAGIEVHGNADNPVTFEQHEALRVEENEKVKNGEISLENDKLYLTYYVDPLTYQVFMNGLYNNEDLRQHYGDNFPTFLVRQISELNRLLAEGNAYIESSSSQFKEVVINRIIVKSDDWSPAAPWHMGYAESRFEDSDGTFGSFETDLPYLPHTFSRWDPVKKVSLENMHELMHFVVRMPDHFWFDTTFVQSEEALKGIPEHFYKYETNKINNSDNPSILTDAGTAKIGSSTMWALASRMRDGEMHKLERTIPEYEGYPQTVPPKNILNLGSEHEGKTVKVYRTVPTQNNQERRLVEIFRGTVNEDGTIDIGNPWSKYLASIHLEFGKDLITEDTGVLLIRVDETQENSEDPLFILDDIRRYIQAHEEKGRSSGGVIHNFILFNKDSTYENAPWNRLHDYEAGEPVPTPPEQPTPPPVEEPPSGEKPPGDDQPETPSEEQNILHMPAVNK